MDGVRKLISIREILRTRCFFEAPRSISPQGRYVHQLQHNSLKDAGPPKLTFTLSESLQQLSKPPEGIPLHKRKGWHLSQVIAMGAIIIAYIGFWSSEYVQLIVRHQRLQTHDRRRIMLFFNDERTRLFAQQAASEVHDEFQALQVETAQLRAEIQKIKQELAQMYERDGSSDAAHGLHHSGQQSRIQEVFKGWVPRLRRGQGDTDV